MLLIAGRDPEARARVRFDSGAVVGGGGFLERARAAFGGVVGEGGVDVEWGEGKADSGGRKREGKGKKPVKEEEKEENEEEEEEKGGRKGEEDGRRKKKGELKKPDEGRRRKRLRRGV